MQPPFENALRAALPGWGFSPDATLRLHTISENTTYVLEDRGTRLALRVYRQGDHREAEIRSELAWIASIRASGTLATPSPVALGGDTLGRFHDGQQHRYAAAFTFVDGAAPAADDTLPRWFETLGATTARLHAQARDWTIPPGFRRPRWDLGALIGRTTRWGRWDRAAGLTQEAAGIIARACTRIARAVAAYGDTPDRFGLIHADLRLANLLVQDERLHVIDFDDCGFGWLVYDFAAAVSFIEHVPDLKRLEAAWIEGYTRHSRLTSADIAMLPSFVLARRVLLLAWITSHAETAQARDVTPGFADATVRLAEAYLARRT